MNVTHTAPGLQSAPETRTKLFLSVVMPAYNETQNLPSVLRNLQAVFGGSRWIEDYEILVVDDHSTDQTLELVRSLKDRRLSCIRLSRRSGSHTAIRAGLASSRGDVVLCISADGQEDPVVLDQMLEKWNRGSHVIWGVRRERKEPFLSKLAALLAYKLIHLFAGPDLYFYNADFYLLSRRVVEAINRCPERHTSLFGLIFWLGFKQDFVEYERRPRLTGKSKWSFASKLRLLMDWVVAFSGVPLKLISFFGIFTAALGLSYALFVILYTLLGYARPGWAETVTLVLVLGGVQMIMIGVLGEYLWRTLDETRSRPLYFVEARSDE